MVTVDRETNVHTTNKQNKTTKKTTILMVSAISILYFFLLSNLQIRHCFFPRILCHQCVYMTMIYTSIGKNGKIVEKNVVC